MPGARKESPHILERWLDRKALQREQERTVARIALEVGADLPSHNGKPTAGTAAGDARKLRGIPAVGRGVTGAVSGTLPGVCNHGPKASCSLCR